MTTTKRPTARVGRGRLALTAALLCLGVALLALFGFGSSPLPRLDIAAFLMVIAGAIICGVLPRPR